MSLPNVAEVLSDRIDDILGPLIPSGGRYALLDFPNHSNAGDSAIWLGETEWLRRRGAGIVYTCDLWTYSTDQLRSCIGDGTILLHGGGNLGDLWTTHQVFRERVIAEFPDNPIIQLPQTIHFRTAEALLASQRAFDAHPDLTILCRDDRSLELARDSYAVKSLLCPDMAFTLGALPRIGEPEGEILWLARTDQEAPRSNPPEIQSGVIRTDWLDEPWTDAAQQTHVISEQLYWDQENWRSLVDSIFPIYQILARERLDRGCGILSRGRVVITNRLHGHILCLLIGIPHILLDNSYGKVASFYRTWTSHSPLVTWCNDPAEALALATDLSRKQ
jgi:pyruvyl transferase EpsO